MISENVSVSFATLIECPINGFHLIFLSIKPFEPLRAVIIAKLFFFIAKIISKFNVLICFLFYITRLYNFINRTVISNIDVLRLQ